MRELVEVTGISHSDFNFEQTIGYEKAIGKMGTAFAHCESQARPCDDFKTRRCFNVIQMNLWTMWTKHGFIISSETKE